MPADLLRVPAHRLSAAVVLARDFGERVIPQALRDRALHIRERVQRHGHVDCQIAFVLVIDGRFGEIAVANLVAELVKRVARPAIVARKRLALADQARDAPVDHHAHERRGLALLGVGPQRVDLPAGAEVTTHVRAVLPLGDFSPLVATGVLATGVLATTVGVGLVESLLARFAFKQVPFLLTLAFLLCLFALLVAWKGGAA